MMQHKTTVVEVAFGLLDRKFVFRDREDLKDSKCTRTEGYFYGLERFVPCEDLLDRRCVQHIFLQRLMHMVYTSHTKVEIDVNTIGF